MTVNDKVMEILKADEKANKMMELFETKAQEHGIVGQAYDEMRKTMLMLIISKTPQAMKTMSDEIYEEVNK